MAIIEVQYSTSKAFASGVIRRLTHSSFSHIDIVIPGQGLLGASGYDKKLNDPGGVVLRSFSPWPYMCPPMTAQIETTDEVVSRTLEFGRSQIGKPFDDKALWHFLRDRGGLKNKGRDWRDPSCWFCSELVVRCFEWAGLFTYPLVVTKDVISPNDTLLLFNPYFTAETIEAFLE